MVSKHTRRAALGISVAASVAVSLTACGGGEPEETPPPATGGATAGVTVAMGNELFQINCAMCHGADGKGGGVAAAALPVQPRDLTAEPYRYVPLDAHATEQAALVDYIRVGRISSGMPAFGHLGDAELQALAMFVESLRPQPNFIDQTPAEAPPADAPPPTETPATDETGEG